MPNTTENRRQDQRVPFDCPITISAGGPKRRGRILDLSCSGARIAYENSRMQVPVSAHRVRIEPPGAEPVEVLAMPVWRTRFSYGVRFLLVDDLERLAVAELMDRATTMAA